MTARAEPEMGHEYVMHRDRDLHDDEIGATPRGRADPALLAAWMDGIVRGDEAAFDALFGALYAPLCRFARGFVGTAHEAEELVEDLFLKLWADRDRLQVRGSVSSYLYVAVRHRALNHLTRLKVARRHAQSAQQDAEWEARHASNAAEEHLREDELYASVRAAVDELPPRSRQAYLLYYQHHLSYAEIAAIMGISVKTVENQLSRALKALWLRLKDELE